MIIPYRTRQVFKRIALAALAVLLVLALIWSIWFIWLKRYVVYTSDGAKLDFSLGTFTQGQVAEEPPPGETVSIYYNEGDNLVQTSTELTQMTGYYIEIGAMQEDIEAVISQVRQLAAGTPVMVDVKNIYGSFYYSSNVSDQRASSVDTQKMDELIKLLNTKDIYTIARLPALRDYYYGLHHVPDGLPLPGGYLWMDDDSCYWLDPTKEGTLTYLVQIVTELKNLGFDEVVFYDFCFPDTESIIFNGDRNEALKQSAQTLVKTCTNDRFAVSFVASDAAFPLPEGRSRMYLENAAAADAANIAVQTGLTDPDIRLVFLTENHDTRFDAFSVLRPLSAAH